MLRDLLSSDGIDVLERTVQFAAQRHAFIAGNIANISTPNFQPVDVNPRKFQALLADAIRRREVTGGPLQPSDSRDISFTPSGLTLRPTPTQDGLLLHDRNDRDLERLMQDLAENLLVHRQATELLRNRYSLLETAIRDRL